MMETIKPFAEYSELDREKVLTWISDNLYPRKYINRNHTGYAIKQRLTSETGVYVRTEQFHEAMTEAGYKSVFRYYPLYWKRGYDYFYNVDSKAPGLHALPFGMKQVLINRYAAIGKAA